MLERKFFNRHFMASDNEYQQKLETEGGKSITEQNTAVPIEENSLRDYMELSAAAHRLRFPRNIEAEFIADYSNSTIITTRWAFTAGFLIYALFGLLDIYVAPVSLR